ncbi:hypothetical protein J7355_16760 [Endozoicomonas sp. G2_2]|uniref:hypothetical protein n=1 Tax=Endozoicomonas sp. G2_2 TaxID=2821092 RepID=UPI001ADB8784|nr:hypothetical protein [Endozoicomonas sp. G2_2]MBO9471744.1 hypothetical protein [Endozoicomonas sp. G2_2]
MNESRDNFDWGSRRCPVYSLAPLKAFGLQMETAGIVVAIIAIGKPMLGMGKATLIALVLAYAYEKASAGRMPNFVAFWASSASESPFARRYLPFLQPLLSRAWGSCGLPPAPGASKRYEP